MYYKSIWVDAHIDPETKGEFNMFCTNCGKQISDTAAFCTHCGSKVANPVPQSEPAVNYQPQPVPHSEPAYEAPSAPIEVGDDEPTVAFSAADMNAYMAQAQSAPVQESAPMPEPQPEPVPEPQPTPAYEPQPVYEQPAQNFEPQPAYEPQSAFEQQPVQQYQEYQPQPMNYYQQSASKQSNGGNIIGIILAAATILFSMLAFFNPVGGLFGWAVKHTEGVNFILRGIMVPIFWIYLATEGGISAGFLTGLVAIVAAIAGLVAVIMLITYIVKGLKGNDKPRRAFIAMTMSFVLTLLLVLTTISFNSSFGNMVRNEMNGMRSPFSAFGDFGEIDDSDMEDFFDEIGIDEDDIEDADDAEEATEILLDNVVKPTMPQYLLILVSLAGMIVVKMKKN